MIECGVVFGYIKEHVFKGLHTTQNVYLQTETKDFARPADRHFSQFCIFQSFIETTRPAKITIRDYSKYSEQRFLQDLSQLHWESLLSGSDVDKLFSTFYNKLNKLINKHAPLRSLSKRKIKRLSKPWITKGIRKSIRIKNELFFSGDRDKYKFYRNKILHLSRISKRTFYFHNYFIQNVNNMKKTWEGINALIRHKKSNKAISRIKRPVWGQATQTNLDKLIILQKRALRLIHFAPYRSHTIHYLFTIISSRLTFNTASQFALLCMTFLTILCRQTFLIYFFILHKCIAIILGFQR